MENKENINNNNQTHDDSSYYSETESKQLNRNLDILGQITESKVKGGIPNDNRDLRLIIEAINASNTAIQKQADIRNKHSDNKSQEELVGSVIDMLRRERSKAPERQSVDDMVLEERYTLSDDDLVNEETSSVSRTKPELEEIYENGKAPKDKE